MRISHGYDAGSARRDRGAAAPRSDSVMIEIEDDGQPFDPLQAPPPDLTLSLAERRIGGLGSISSANLMDEMSYSAPGWQEYFETDVMNFAT